MFVFLSRQQREEDLLKNLEKERCLPGIFRPLVLEEVWLSLLLWKNWLYSFLLFLFFLPFFGNFNIHTYEEFSKAFSVVSHVRQESDIVVAAIYVMSEVYHYSLKTLLDFGFLDCVYSEFFVVFFLFSHLFYQIMNHFFYLLMVKFVECLYSPTYNIGITWFVIIFIWSNPISSIKQGFLSSSMNVILCYWFSV